MRSLIINIDTDSSLRKIMELVKKLRLKSKLLEQETPEQEHNDWSNLGIQNLANAYKSDEPDIDDLLLKEPNPEYNPWKKGVL